MNAGRLAKLRDRIVLIGNLLFQVILFKRDSVDAASSISRPAQIETRVTISGAKAGCRGHDEQSPNRKLARSSDAELFLQIAPDPL